MAYELPKLAYAYDALEPHIDARTMEIHHTKHHNAYVTNLNNALSGAGITGPECIADLLPKIGELPAAIQTAVRNNGGGHANHALFWTILSPNGGGAPKGALAGKINAVFGSLDTFKKEFGTAATTRFGSGWAWLCAKKDGGLCVCSTANQDNPQMAEQFGGGSCSCVPILGLDVWEHAYYLNYQNRRPNYITAFWNVVDWDQVERYYAQAIA